MRRSRRSPILLALVLLLAAAGGAGLERSLGGGERAGALTGRVTRIVDGDTIRVRLRGGEQPVRYIGIDTPETHRPVECFGRAASAYNERLVRGRRVRLVLDAEPRDRYGRLLAYVYRSDDGLFVNAALARAGYATTLTIPPNVAHATGLRDLQRAARRDRRGLWRTCQK